MANSEPNAIGIKDTPDEHGGVIREITAVSLENDTVNPDNLLFGATAHNSSGEQIVGNLPGSEVKAIGIKDTLDEHGGIIREITAVSLETDTVQPDTLLTGVTAHDAEGNPIIGTMRPSGSQLILEHTLIGKLTRPQRIIGTITKPNSLTGTISRAPVKEVVYAGPYVVEPKFEDQTLETSQKFMTADVTVKEIAVSRTTNLSGGITVYIGGLE